MPETRKDNRGISPKAVSAREQWQRSKRRKTRRRIRDNALQLFAERGYDNVTVHQIAEQSEVTPITLFRYFPKKEDCILSLPEDGGMMEQQLRLALHHAATKKTPMELAQLILHNVFASLACRELEQLARRLDIIRANETLLHALYARTPVWQEMIARQLREEGIDEYESRLLGVMIASIVIEVLLTWSRLRGDGDVPDQDLLLQTADSAYATLHRGE